MTEDIHAFFLLSNSKVQSFLLGFLRCLFFRRHARSRCHLIILFLCLLKWTEAGKLHEICLNGGLCEMSSPLTNVTTYAASWFMTISFRVKMQNHIEWKNASWPEHCLKHQEFESIFGWAGLRNFRSVSFPCLGPSFFWVGRFHQAAELAWMKSVH